MFNKKIWLFLSVLLLNNQLVISGDTGKAASAIEIGSTEPDVSYNPATNSIIAWSSYWTSSHVMYTEISKDLTAKKFDILATRRRHNEGLGLTYFVEPERQNVAALKDAIAKFESYMEKK